MSFAQDTSGELQIVRKIADNEIYIKAKHNISLTNLNHL